MNKSICISVRISVEDKKYIDDNGLSQTYLLKKAILAHKLANQANLLKDIENNLKEVLINGK